MEQDLFDIGEEELKNAYKVLKVNGASNDIELEKQYQKLSDMYGKHMVDDIDKLTRNSRRIWEGDQATEKKYFKTAKKIYRKVDSLDIIDDAYKTILAYRLNKKYASCYKLKDKSIVLSLPDATFFEQSSTRKFMQTMATDYAKICGGGEGVYLPKIYDGCEGYIKTMFKNKMTDPKSSCLYYLKTDDWYECDYVHGNNIEDGMYAKKRFPGIRPIIDLSRSDFKFNYDEKYYEVEFGEYIQWLPPANISMELEHAYLSNDLVPIGKTYTKDVNTLDHTIEEYMKIQPLQQPVYSYKDKKYVRVVHTVTEPLYQYRLSNGKMTSSQDVYWLEVSPVKCIAFPKKKILLSKYTIMSGIPYIMYENPKEDNLIDSFKNYSTTYYLKKLFTDQCNLLYNRNPDLIFEMTDMYMFLNEYMKNDLLSTDAIDTTLDMLEMKKVKSIGEKK